MKHIELFESFAPSMETLPVQDITGQNEAVFYFHMETDIWWGIVPKNHPKLQELIDLCNQLIDKYDMGNCGVFEQTGIAYLIFDANGDFAPRGPEAESETPEADFWYTPQGSVNNPNHQEAKDFTFMSLGKGITHLSSIHHGGYLEDTLSTEETINYLKNW